jgi:hypothetical protein
MEEKISLALPAMELRRVNVGPRVFAGVLMRAGPTLNTLVIPAEVLKASVDSGLWLGRVVFEHRTAPSIFLNHPGFFDGPQVQKLIGRVLSVTWDEMRQAVTGELHLLDTPEAEIAARVFEQILVMDTPPDVGLSGVVSLVWEWQGEGQAETRVVTELRTIWGVDVVCFPAAGGVVEKVLNSVGGWPASLNQAGASPVPLPQGGNNMSTLPNPAAGQSPPPATDDYNVAIVQASSTQDEHLQASANQLLELRLANSGLPAPMQDELRDQFLGTLFKPVALDRAVARRRETLAALAESGVISGHDNPRVGARVTGFFNTYDKIEAAYEKLMGLEVSNPSLRDVPALTGIKELYIGLTGDRMMRGIFVPEMVSFAISGATSPNTAAIMAELTRNVQNKLLLTQWAKLAGKGYEWWKRAVATENFNSLQTTSWIVSGGFGDIATVAEGGVYPELAWDDKRETIDFVKKGGYVSLTLEMIDKDDVQGWKAVGKNLATTALRTLSITIANIFINNPTLNEDGVALFHATHGNLLSASLDATSWDLAVQAIYKMAEFSSGKRLGFAPDRVLVPIEMRKAAIQLFYSDHEPGGNKNDVNVAPMDGIKDSAGPVIVVPEFTAALTWIALCDPDLAPVVGLGFRFGEKPELFTATDPNSFLLFFQDALPIKVRYFFAVGAVDFRAAVKSVV